MKYMIFVLVFLQGLVSAAHAAAVYITPRSVEALTSPTPTLAVLADQQIRKDRAFYSVMIGKRDFDTLEKAAEKIAEAYRQHKISADDFTLQAAALVPMDSDKLQLPDLQAWTQERPKSYVAWYVLGRQYLNIARVIRGDKWASDVSRDQFAEMDKYARMAHAAGLKALSLNPRFIPVYRILVPVGSFVLNADKKYFAESCAQLRVILPQRTNECAKVSDSSDLSKEFLMAATEVEPDQYLLYEIYIDYNTPRWGKNYGTLYELAKRARQNGHITTDRLTDLEAYIMYFQARDAADLDKDPARAADLFIKAFNHAPKAEHLNWLHDAGYYARQARKVDFAIEIYNKALSVNKDDYEALFQRGVTYREEKHDNVRYFADQAASAMLGYKYAQNNIGYYYMSGDSGYPVNLQEAKAWLTLAANQGYQHARDKLSVVERLITVQQGGSSKP
ncbi:DUF4034 domain-containing protein [Uliginosibacterium sediminicola]|uniref:DUF4034 domain-containing protein n=1 Tax=Uliginosibacterium sediminicola TaxID=2024550 RepID=A0ABU9YVL5_9RHOO